MRRLSPDSVDDQNTVDDQNAGGASSAEAAANSSSVRPAERKAGKPRQQHSDSTDAARAASVKNRNKTPGAAGAAVAGVAAAGAAAGAGAKARADKSGPAESGGSTGAAGSKAKKSSRAAGASSAPAGAAAAAGSGGAGSGGSAASGGSGSGSGGSAPEERDPAATRKPFLWLVLGLAVVAAIVLGIVIIGFNSGEEEPTPVSETSAPSEQPTKKEEKKTPKADPPKIENVESLDPEGDGSEHDSEVENVIPKTEGSWNTDRYNSASFGNLKSGVGLLFEFEDETTISKVKVASGNSGGKFEIRDGDDPEDAKVIGEGVFDAEGAVTVEFDEEVETDKLILWITDLPQTDGGFKATISSVKFS